MKKETKQNENDELGEAINCFRKYHEGLKETRPDRYVHNLLQRLIDNRSKPTLSIATKRREIRDNKNWIKKENKLQKEANKLKRKEKKDKRAGIYLVRNFDKKDKVVRAFMKVTRKGGQVNDCMEKVNS